VVLSSQAEETFPEEVLEIQMAAPSCLEVEDHGGQMAEGHEAQISKNVEGVEDLSFLEKILGPVL